MSIADSGSGNTPVHDAQTVLLSALIQSTAGHILPLAHQLKEHDFTPAGWTVYSEILRTAQDAAQTDRNAVMNLVVVNASLTAQGALSDAHDDGTRALLAEITTTPADPLWLPELIAALKQQAYRRAGEAFTEQINNIDWQTVGIEESDETLAQAIQQIRAARARINTTAQTTGGHLEAA